MDFLVGGLYVDRFQKRDGVWKISNRTGLTGWMRAELPSTQAFADIPLLLQGHRGDDDFVFHARKTYGQE